MGEACKICGGASLELFQHTARCRRCDVLLYYPYPADGGPPRPSDAAVREATLAWYSRSSFYSHANLTAMVRFAMYDAEKGRRLRVLDYGGGGGQFALVCRSLFPEATVYITDIWDAALLSEWRESSVQIPFAGFADDPTTFDFIFMNDVFEHVDDPGAVLKQLRGKLAPGGRLFIDTPRQFWLYPLVKATSRSVYAKLLRGTVSTAHLQIWSAKSFRLIVAESGFRVIKFRKQSAYTMPAAYYLRNMGISGSALTLLGHAFHASARWLAPNKLICLLEADSPEDGARCP